MAGLKFLLLSTSLISLTTSCGEAKTFTSLENPFALNLNSQSPTVGTKLTCTPSSKRDDLEKATEPPNYDFTWQTSSNSSTNFVPVENQTQDTFVITSAVAHKYIRCSATSKMPTGETTSAESAAVLIADTSPVGTDVEFFGSQTSSFTVYLSLDSGITDADTDQLTGIDTQNILGGTLSAWSCSDGFCTATFSPTTTLTNGFVLFEYKAKNAFGAMETWAKATFRTSSGGT